MDPQRSVNDQRSGREQDSSRLHLNFGYGERNVGADVGRAFPTTPSTFPQPVHTNQYGQREIWGNQPAAAAYGNAGYFMSNPYQPPQFQQTQSLPVPNGLRTPAAYNDATNGLVHDFQHQNLGGNATPRSESPYGRQPSPASQLRPSAPSNPQPYGNFLTPQLPSHNGIGALNDELPIKVPEKYSDNVFKRSRVSTELISAFFKENVQRARDRNQRLTSPDHSPLPSN